MYKRQKNIYKSLVVETMLTVLLMLFFFIIRWDRCAAFWFCMFVGVWRRRLGGLVLAWIVVLSFFFIDLRFFLSWSYFSTVFALLLCAIDVHTYHIHTVNQERIPLHQSKEINVCLKKKQNECCSWAKNGEQRKL